ncbi:MAG: hypothetical protein Q7T16_01675 [Candidatus Burarchaeum sp.]|nr:hypothetical protein [Candidatus Burarchaeum sp.]MDO8339344.1 hypothetical protein [Candidatus Burarchaeum sp.]
MRKYFPAALALLAISLLLIGCTGIPNPTPPAQSAEKGIVDSWFTENWAATSLLIVLIIFFILGILYMLSQSFSNRELHAWVVTEFFQNLMSIVIIVILVVLFVSVSQLSEALVNLSDPASPTPPCSVSECHFGLASNYLEQLILIITWPQNMCLANIDTSPTSPCMTDPVTARVIEVDFEDPPGSNNFVRKCPADIGSSPPPVCLKDATGQNIVPMGLADYSTMRAISRMSLSTYKISLVAVDLLPFLFSGYSMRPYAGFSIYADRHMLIADYSLRLAASLNAQKLFLQYVQTALVPLLLIAGVLLRAIFFTRKLGGLMIAIAIALFTVYPLTYFVFQYTFPVAMEVESTSVGGIDPLASCVPAELYVVYPKDTTSMCTAACDVNPNTDPSAPSDPSKNAPSFAKTACKTECTAYCTDQYEVLDNACYERCATGSPNYIFLCSITYSDDNGDGLKGYECDDAAEAAGGILSTVAYRTAAKAYMGIHHPGIATCNDLVIETADPYAAVGECSITNAAGAQITCPSRALADCRVTYRALTKKADGTYERNPEPDGPLVYAFPDYYDEVLPQLPNECKASPDIVEACKLCAANIGGVTTPAEAERLTILPDPQMQADCTKSDILESGTIPPLDSDKFTVSGDIEAAAKLLIAGIILPIFSFIITITFAKCLSPLLGGDFDIAGIMRMI